MLVNVLLLTVLGVCWAVETPRPAAGTCTSSSEQSCFDEQREERCLEIALRSASDDVAMTITSDSWCYCSHGTVRSCVDVCPEYAKHDEDERRACTSVCPDYWRCLELIDNSTSFEDDKDISGSITRDATTRKEENAAGGALLWTKKPDPADCPHGTAHCGRNQDGDEPGHRLLVEELLYCPRLAAVTFVLFVYYFVLPSLLTSPTALRDTEH